jgi:hypothetical protein
MAGFINKPGNLKRRINCKLGQHASCVGKLNDTLGKKILKRLFLEMAKTECLLIRNKVNSRGSRLSMSGGSSLHSMVGEFRLC